MKYLFLVISIQFYLSGNSQENKIFFFDTLKIKKNLAKYSITDTLLDNCLLYFNSNNEGIKINQAVSSSYCNEKFLSFSYYDTLNKKELFYGLVSEDQVFISMYKYKQIIMNIPTNQEQELLSFKNLASHNKWKYSFINNTGRINIKGKKIKGEFFFEFELRNAFSYFPNTRINYKLNNDNEGLFPLNEINVLHFYFVKKITRIDKNYFKKFSNQYSWNNEYDYFSMENELLEHGVESGMTL